MTFKEKTGVQSVRLALGLLAGSLAIGQAFADDAAPATIKTTDKTPRVEITGSNIKRIDTETASPVQIISRTEIERSGASSLSDVIRAVAANNTGSLSGTDFNSFSPGAKTASLRGLGSGSTLVLVNGRRIAQFGITGFQSQFENLDSVPLAAVDRVEVLLDGASAIYGSEAIAGVINIILRKDYTGGEVKVGGGMTQTGKNGSGDFNLAFGKGDIAADRYNIFAMYEHHNEAALSARDINAYSGQDYRGMGFTKGDRRSSYSYPGNYFDDNGKIVPVPGCPQSNIGANGRCLLDRLDYTYALPKTSRDSFFTRGVFELNADHRVFVEAGITQNTSHYQFDPQFYYNDDAGFLETADNAYLYRAADIGPRRIKVGDTESRLLVGLQGTVGGWDYDTAAGFMKSKVTVDNTGLILVDQMEAALADGSYVPAGANSAATIARISPTLTRRGENKNVFVDLKVSNSELFKLPGGSAGMAAGIEYRKATSSDIDDPNYETGNVFAFGGLPPLDSRSIRAAAAYAELTMPVTKTLEIATAARADHYSEGGNSTTPKLGFKWNALSNLVIRGTYAKGFRAPNFRETSPRTSVGFYNGVADPVRCQTGNEPDCNLSIQANISGNANLQPEKSKSNTLGVVWEPVKNYSVSVDLYRITRNNEISSLDLDYLLAQQADPNFSQYITRDANGQITAVSLPYINLGKTQVSGVDLDFKGKQNLGELGNLSFDAKISYTASYLVTPFPDSPTVDYNGTYDQPRSRSHFSATWEKGPWTNAIATDYTRGYKYIGTPTDTCNITAIWGAPSTYCEIQSTQTWDWFTGYKGFKNIELGLHIFNIFNAMPPFDAKNALANVSLPYNQDYSSPLGRRFLLTAKYTFK
jgi:iron complex outermembrane receptor protein